MSSGPMVRALIAVLWRAELRISDALALNETDIDGSRGSLLIRHGKADKRRAARHGRRSPTRRAAVFGHYCPLDLEGAARRGRVETAVAHHSRPSAAAAASTSTTRCEAVTTNVSRISPRRPRCRMLWTPACSRRA